MMCGRARCTLRVEDVGRAAGFRNPLRSVDGDRYRPSYNVAPGRYMPVVRHRQVGEAPEQGSSDPVVHCMKWGLVPSFTKMNEKPDHYRMVISVAETSNCYAVQRTLGICASQIYIQQTTKEESLRGNGRRILRMEKDGSKRQPYYLHFRDDRPFVFAGLYDSWKDEEGNVLNTFTILTTRNSKAIGWLHDRMPVILPNEAAVNSWLNDELTEASIHKLTLPYEASDLVWYPVTVEMGKPSFDVPECIQEIKAKPVKDSSIFQLFGKRKNMEISSQEKVRSSLSSDNTEHQFSGENFLFSTVVKDEDLETEEDKQALLAGMEPDKDVIQEEMTYKEGPLEVKNLQNNNPAFSCPIKEEFGEENISVKEEVPSGGVVVKEVIRKDFEVKEKAEEDHGIEKRVLENGFTLKEEVAHDDAQDLKRVASSHVKETAWYEPDAKKRLVSPRGSEKISGRTAGKATLPNKQSSLHWFFGKK